MPEVLHRLNVLVDRKCAVAAIRKMSEITAYYAGSRALLQSSANLCLPKEPLDHDVLPSAHQRDLEAARDYAEIVKRPGRRSPTVPRQRIRRIWVSSA